MKKWSFPNSSRIIRDGPWSFRTSKNLQKSSNLPLGRPWGFRKKSEKIIRKHRSERLFGPIFSNFPMLAHVVSLRGDSRAFILLKTWILSCLHHLKSDSWSRYDRVITAHAEKSPNLRRNWKVLFQFCFAIFSKSYR